MNQQTNDEGLRERLMVSTALGAQQREPDTEGWQPDAEQWQAFLQGRLAADLQEPMLAYLDTHPDAYAEWVACVADQVPRESKQQAPGLWQRFDQWLAGQGGRQNWALPAAALGVVVLLSVALLLRGPAGVDTDLDLAYGRFAQPGVSIPDQQMPDSAADPGFAFAGSDSSHSLNAFVQGIGAGRRQLERILASDSVEGSSTTESIRPEYFRLGRWYYLTWFVARTGLQPREQFWQGQERILGQIRSAMDLLGEDETAKPVARQLDEIASILERLERTPGDARARRDLRRELEGLRQIIQVVEES